MIQFVVLQHTVLDPGKDQVVDAVISAMQRGPVIWIEEEEDIHKVVQWCHALYPRRLLLHHLQQIPPYAGSLTVLTPQALPIPTSTPATFLSRGALLPAHQTFHQLIHWVDDDREKNRECYRIYQKRGHHVETQHAAK